jgi:hypothetical protein
MANDPAFSWRAFLRTVFPRHCPQAILALLVLAFCFPSASKADEIPVTVLFTNGDRLTGTLEGLDGGQIRFRPQAVHGLGNSINFDWQQDSLAELRAGPGCLYQKSPKDQPSNVCFQNAVIRPSGDNTVSITTEDGQTLSKVTLLSPTPIVTPATTTGTPGPVAALATSPLPAQEKSLVSMWSVGLNAPESAVNATQSSQNLGGSLFTNLYFGDPNHLIISAAGTHQHNYSPGKSIKTDIFDSIVQFGHTFGNTPGTKYTFYQVGEWFFNTSLGLAAQRSVGAGLVFPTWRSKSEKFSLKAGADLRYFNERLYSAHPALDLVGSRFRAQAIYTPSDRKWFISAITWINPMWNNEGAWQGYANLTLSVPFGKHVCLDFTPADDTYLENAPHGNRKNYLSSTATLKIIGGPNPGQVCSQ